MPVRDTAWPAGTPCWVDYTATDVPAAQKFYGALLGWSFTEGQPEFGGYLTCLAEDRAAAGMMQRMDPADPPAWTTYFATDDADATAAAIVGAGGTTVAGPMDVGPLGRMLVALDPQGEVFGAWQAGLQTGLQVYNQPGALTWTEQAVADPTVSRAFYGAVFGFAFQDVPDGSGPDSGSAGGGGYTTFDREPAGTEPLGGITTHQPGRPQGWAPYFSVASMDDAVATVEQAGGTVLTAPLDTPHGRMAVVADPWGAAFWLRG